MPGADESAAGLLEVAIGPEAKPVAQVELTPDVLRHDGALHEVALPFTLSRTELSVEFRARSYGRTQLAALLHVDVGSDGPVSATSMAVPEGASA
jgi:hypothetical protein